MEKQNKFLDKKYIENRLDLIKEIHTGQIHYSIEESNRVMSKSLYVNFYCGGTRCHTLRISDHTLPSCVHTQFIVEPFENATKKKRLQFAKLVDSCIQKAMKKYYYTVIRKMEEKVLGI